MYLVGLHIYYKMIHGPYNIKLCTPVGNFYSCLIYRDTEFRNVPHSYLCHVSDRGVASSVDVAASDSSLPISFSSFFLSLSEHSQV